MKLHLLTGCHALFLLYKPVPELSALTLHPYVLLFLFINRLVEFNIYAFR